MLILHNHEAFLIISYEHIRAKLAARQTQMSIDRDKFTAAYKVMVDAVAPDFDYYIRFGFCIRFSRVVYPDKRAIYINIYVRAVAVARDTAFIKYPAEQLARRQHSAVVYIFNVVALLFGGGDFAVLPVGERTR